MSNINIVNCADAGDAVLKASEKLNSILKNLHDQDVPVLLCMSGGSALKIADQIDKNYIPKKFTLTVLDDRYSKDEKVNNFSLLMNTPLYKDALSLGANFIDTRIKNDESISEISAMADMGIKEWIEGNPDGKIIITQGIGPDGHTSGMMPYPEDQEKFDKLFVDTDKFSVGYDNEGKNEYHLRITSTMKFLIDHVDESVLLMTGKEKSQAFHDAWDSSKTLAQTPGRVIHQMKKVNLFTDIAKFN